MSEMDMSRDLGLIIPEIAIVITAVLALVAEMLRRPRLALIATVVGLLAAALLTIPLFGEDTTVFLGTYRIDDLSLWAKVIILPATALSAILFIPEIRGTDREGTVYSLLSFVAAGSVILAGAGDIMFIVLGVLISSLGSFVLVAYPRDDRATEAAMKYFVFGSVTGAMMIFGLTYWFGATGSTLLSELDRLDGRELAGIAGLLGVLIGLGYKASIAPFHFWAPDAYDGGPVAAAAFISIVPKIGAIFGIAQVMRSLPESAVEWPLLIALLAAFSMTFGNLAALVQTNLIRLLAYSSIAQAGYFLLAIVALDRSDLDISALVVFAAAYAAMNLGAFAVVGWAGRDLEGFRGVGRTLAPWHGAAMVIFLLSLVGVPPLGGFVGKLLLFGAAIDAGYTWLAVVGILNTVLSLAVYLRVIVPMYQPADGDAVSGESRSIARTSITVLSVLLTLGIGIGAQVILTTTI
ncbi:MAG: NADH-quinone oxidoreductase subunit N [Thermomicrobiales bacterium]